MTSFTTALEGPNTNVMYSKGPMKLRDFHVYVHSWLEQGSDFAKAQKGDFNPAIGTRSCRASDIDTIRERTITHETRHYEEDKKFYVANDVQGKMEAAHAQFDFSMLDRVTAGTLTPEVFGEAQKAAQNSATEEAYGRDWTAKVRTSVDVKEPIKMPSCTPSNFGGPAR